MPGRLVDDRTGLRVSVRFRRRTYDHWTMNTLLAIVPAIALLVAAAGLARLIRETQKENRRQRERATVNYITSTIQRQHELYSDIEQDSSFAAKASVVNSAEFHQLTSYFAYLEYLSAAVNMKIFDGDVVSRTIGSRIIRAYETFREWMDTERQRLNSKTVYEELDILVADLRERRDQRNAVREAIE
jgi:Domain of unknown function (DUF4760)